jgi:hypothetical protein
MCAAQQQRKLTRGVEVIPFMKVWFRNFCRGAAFILTRGCNAAYAVLILMVRHFVVRDVVKSLYAHGTKQPKGSLSSC